MKLTFGEDPPVLSDGTCDAGTLLAAHPDQLTLEGAAPATPMFFRELEPEPPTPAQAQRMRAIAEPLRDGVPPDPELEQLRDKLFELLAQTKEYLLSTPGTTLILGDLLQRRDEESARSLWLHLMEASLNAEEHYLPADEDGCWALVDHYLKLSDAEIAPFAPVTPETVASWREGNPGRRSHEVLRDLSRCGYWLARSGMGVREAREWLFDRRHPRLDERTPADFFNRKASASPETVVLSAPALIWLPRLARDEARAALGMPRSVERVPRPAR